VIRGNVAQGIYAFFITDDNFARNKDWEALLDRVIELRQKEGWGLSFTIQVDTLCHKLPNFIEKCAKAGVRRCFIGLENINPDSLLGAKKRQNKITDYRGMMLAWKQAKIMTVGGYILGFPNDTLASIVRDIKIVQDELPIDMLEFFSSRRYPVRRITRRCTRRASRWIRTSTNMIWTTSRLRI
jgi:radical SAM superfamily enzyme YgiQ (UPF0313 family)